MRARHTQARPRFRAITSKALVNRTRMKVVKIGLTKVLKTAPKTRCRPGERRDHNHRWLWSARRADEWLIPSASLRRSVWVPAFAGTTSRELRLSRRGLAERGLRCGEARDRHAVGRA